MEQEAKFNEVLALIEEGYSVEYIGKILKVMPSSTFYKCLKEEKFPNCVENYARACEVRANLMFEEIIVIADNESEDVHRSRLRMDARRWCLSKMNPKKYGDKIDTNITGSLAVNFIEQKSYDQKLIEPNDTNS